MQYIASPAKDIIVTPITLFIFNFSRVKMLATIVPKDIPAILIMSARIASFSLESPLIKDLNIVFIVYRNLDSN
ncbi:hypothetical protein NUKP79_48250 [Klebsiella quasipneumoniae]|nr:hypothetical protein NUKP79_48250 [Klebsiella quasipneumoniae]